MMPGGEMRDDETQDFEMEDGDAEDVSRRDYLSGLPAETLLEILKHLTPKPRFLRPSIQSGCCPTTPPILQHLLSLCLVSHHVCTWARRCLYGTLFISPVQAVPLLRTLTESPQYCAYIRHVVCLEHENSSFTAPFVDGVTERRASSSSFTAPFVDGVSERRASYRLRRQWDKINAVVGESAPMRAALFDTGVLADCFHLPTNRLTELAKGTIKPLVGRQIYDIVFHVLNRALLAVLCMAPDYYLCLEAQTVGQEWYNVEPEQPWLKNTAAMVQPPALTYSENARKAASTVLRLQANLNSYALQERSPWSMRDLARHLALPNLKHVELLELSFIDPEIRGPYMRQPFDRSEMPIATTVESVCLWRTAANEQDLHMLLRLFPNVRDLCITSERVPDTTHEYLQPGRRSLNKALRKVAGTLRSLRLESLDRWPLIVTDEQPLSLEMTQVEADAHPAKGGLTCLPKLTSLEFLKVDILSLAVPRAFQEVPEWFPGLPESLVHLELVERFQRIPTTVDDYASWLQLVLQETVLDARAAGQLPRLRRVVLWADMNMSFELWTRTWQLCQSLEPAFRSQGLTLSRRMWWDRNRKNQGTRMVMHPPRTEVHMLDRSKDFTILDEFGDIFTDPPSELDLGAVDEYELHNSHYRGLMDYSISTDPLPTGDGTDGIRKHGYGLESPTPAVYDPLWWRVEN